MPFKPHIPLLVAGAIADSASYKNAIYKNVIYKQFIYKKRGIGWDA